jgi:hypothetical protein
MLHREDWSPTVNVAEHTMHWGRARYNDVGFEGWGCLPLANFAAIDSARLSQLAAEHWISLPSSVGNGGPDHQRHVFSRCRQALTPRFVVTLHEDPWVGELSTAPRKASLTLFAEQLVSHCLMIIIQLAHSSRTMQPDDLPVPV